MHISRIVGDEKLPSKDKQEIFANQKFKRKLNQISPRLDGYFQTNLQYNLENLLNILTQGIKVSARY